MIIWHEIIAWRAKLMVVDDDGDGDAVHACLPACLPDCMFARLPWCWLDFWLRPPPIVYLLAKSGFYVQNSFSLFSVFSLFFFLFFSEAMICV